MYIATTHECFFVLLICSIYSGTVAGAREAFLYGIPAIAMSYDWYAKFFSLFSSTMLKPLSSDSAAACYLVAKYLFIYIKCYSFL
jgi:broad specificity polyphosphatase/5'/3'-nucleotidase SurE